VAKPTSIDELKGIALKAISQKAGIKQPVLRHSAEDVVPSTGKSVYFFSATDKSKPNDPSVSVVLDESGAAVDLANLTALEGRSFFRPLFPGIPPEVLEPRRIKIDPPRNDLRLEECDRFSETVTVTIPKSGAVSKADIYFLADTTGSMTDILAAVQAGASNILTALGGLGLDLAYGVGNYKDFPSDPYAFAPQQSVTTVEASVQAAINAWTASGGGDTPEGQFFALDKLAEPPAGPIGWRAGAKRIIVWFGDAPGHDPVCKAISGLASDITEGSVTTKLVAEKISVIAISTTTGTPGALDADPVPLSSDYNAACGAAGGAAGQATRIANATGGAHAVGINAATIVQTIIDLIKAVVGSINNVRLVPDPVIAPFVVAITPAGGYGPLPGDKDHVLKFEVTFAPGDVRCTTRDQVFVGSLNVVADGTVVAKKPTRITIPACKFTYSVKFVCGVQQECECACTPVRPGVYATEINIHNYKCHDAVIEKWLIPTVLAGAPVGREPRVVKRRIGDRIKLPADSATMDDCCRITEMLLGAPSTSPMPLTIGFLEIVSNVELSVTAVYTASDLKSNGLSIDVQNITPRLK
jgi:hypothetical protein